MGRKGGDVVVVVVLEEAMMDGGGEKLVWVSVSILRILSREEGRSQGGGRMLALRWRLRRRASHSGSGALCGGFRAGVDP